MHLAPSSFWGPDGIHRICAHSSTEQPAPAAQKQPESCSSFSTTHFGTEIPGKQASGQCRRVQGLGGVLVIGRSMDPTGQVWRVPWHGARGWGQDGLLMHSTHSQEQRTRQCRNNAAGNSQSENKNQAGRCMYITEPTDEQM